MLPKFVIEAQYLLPVYKHEVVEAPDLAAACRKVIENDNWDFAVEDYDNARPTIITEAVEIPADYAPHYTGASPAAHALYGAGLPKLDIPSEFTRGTESGAAAIFVLTVQWRNCERDIEVFSARGAAEARIKAIALAEYPDEYGDTDAFSDHGHSWWIDEVPAPAGIRIRIEGVDPMPLYDVQMATFIEKVRAITAAANAPDGAGDDYLNEGGGLVAISNLEDEAAAILEKVRGQ